MSIEQMAKDIVQGDRTALARGITLVESQLPADWEKAKRLLSLLRSPKPCSQRLGFSGPPGAGKSTFIEKLGLAITQSGEKVAVLAIDPSSDLSGGSILGDKTRMEQLSRSPLAFVRPSPTRGHLGGVTSRLPGVIELCEAAGYQWIVIESVGVGQSEVELSKMVDFFTLIAQPGGGDELQGIKKGILEYVDLIVVNKVDRDPQLVNTTKQQLLAALKILRGKSVQVESCSALTGEGVDRVLKSYRDFFDEKGESLDRSQFAMHWFDSLVLSEFRKRLSQSPLKEKTQIFREQVGDGQVMPVEAVDLFFSDIGLTDK